MADADAMWLSLGFEHAPTGDGMADHEFSLADLMAEATEKRQPGQPGRASGHVGSTLARLPDFSLALGRDRLGQPLDVRKRLQGGQRLG